MDTGKLQEFTKALVALVKDLEQAQSYTGDRDYDQGVEAGQYHASEALANILNFYLDIEV